MGWDLQQEEIRLKVGLHVAFWLIFLLSYIAVFTRFFDWSTSTLRAFGNVTPMAVLFYVNLYLVDFFLEKRKYLLYAFLVALLVFALVILRVRINMLFPEMDERFALMDEVSSWRFGAAATNFLILLLSTFYQLLMNRFDAERRNMSIINEQREAQLQFLRGQINPHFLFNTLNNIYSLAVIQSQKTAPMVLQLSSLLRYVIYESREETVPLNREIRHLEAFVQLFQMRSEGPRDIRWVQRGNPEGLWIEPMILIPLVENSFKHCDFETNPEAYIHLQLTVEEQILHFSTENTYNTADQQKDRVGGIGLENIRKRLALKYPQSSHLHIDHHPGIFRVELELTLTKKVAYAD